DKATHGRLRVSLFAIQRRWHMPRAAPSLQDGVVISPLVVLFHALLQLQFALLSLLASFLDPIGAGVEIEGLRIVAAHSEGSAFGEHVSGVVLVAVAQSEDQIGEAVVKVLPILRSDVEWFKGSSRVPRRTEPQVEVASLVTPKSAFPNVSE